MPANTMIFDDVLVSTAMSAIFSTEQPPDFFYNVSTIYYNQSSSSASSIPPPQQVNYINVTNELPINYAIPMYGQTMPFLLIITIIANTLIVVVLSKRHMRTPTNVVLIAMALCDMFTLLFPAPWLIYMYTLGNHYKPLWPISLCYIWFVMHEVSFLLFFFSGYWGEKKRQIQ